MKGTSHLHGIVAIAATHEGKSKTDSSRDNPHVHIIITTRKVDEKGFSKKKYRELNNRDYVYRWRKEWELIINRAYRRNKVPKRVSCESLEVQGKERIEPTIHLTRTDHEKEKRGYEPKLATGSGRSSLIMIGFLQKRKKEYIVVVLFFLDKDTRILNIKSYIFFI